MAQDLALHGYYTEPSTGITFYTSYEPNGTIVGDGEFSEVSWGGYTFGIALPPSALTVDSFDYIGLIVSFEFRLGTKSSTKNVLDRFSSQWHRMVWCTSWR